MSTSSYDDLLRQVERLKMENSTLRTELQDNSSHLTKLETEASTMKDVLSHLHTAMEDDNASDTDSHHGDACNNYQNTGDYGMSVANMSDSLDQNSNSSADDGNSEKNWNQSTSTKPTPLPSNQQAPSNQGSNQRAPSNQGINHQSSSNSKPESKTTSTNPEAPKQAHVMSRGSVSMEEDGGDGAESPGSPRSPGSPHEDPPQKKRSGEKELYSSIQDLDRERNSLLQEIENEDKHRKWYYDQLEGLEQKIHSLPITDNYNLQADMTRRQLEFEIQRIQEVMRENLGTSEHIAQRHEARLRRIHMIETEMVTLQHRHRQQLEQEKELSCSRGNLTGSDGDNSFVLESAAGTNVASEVSFVEASYHELQGDLPEGTVLYNGPHGSKLVTIATQTADQLFDAGVQFDGDTSGRQASNHNLASLYHGAWPIDSNGATEAGSLAALANQDTASVMSFQTNNTSSTSFSHAAQHHLGTKVEMVYSLLSMLGTHDKDDMSRTLLAMSSSQDSCIAMRQSGCLPLLIQLLHGNDKDSGLLGNTRGSKAARARAAAALHNIVHSHPDDKRGRREARVLRLLEQIRAHCDQLRGTTEEGEDGKRSRPGSGSADIDHHPGPAIAALMKLSFDEEHRHAICTLGGLQAIGELLQLDHEVNSNTTEQYNITMRRYACMALTNLTFGDGTNKALLCSMKSSMRALVAQLQSPNEDLRQVAASVLRNLSWRADLASKKTLREVGSVSALMIAAMEVTKESTLKSILSALWNLSAHCSENKADICCVDGSLAFLVTSLTFKSPSKTLSIIENGGGILRNVSSHVAIREDYRRVLRLHGCLQILLKHLRSPSLTIVSNACGTLWNLSARCPEDQKALWEMGAVSMLRNLVHSKHKMISMGSAAALKNLLSARPGLGHIDGDRIMPTNRPGLHVRKQRALEAEIDQNLAETCENLESPTGSPTEIRKNEPVKHKYILPTDGRGAYQPIDNERKLHLRGPMYTRGGSADNSPLVEHRIHSPSRGVTRSGSQDSVGSTHSDISHDRGRIHNAILKGNRLSQDRNQNGGSEPKGSSSKGDTSPKGGSDKASSSGHSQGSRIMQVMKEVVQHANMDNSNLTDNAFNRDNMSKSVDSSLQRNNDQPRIPVYQSKGFPRTLDNEEVFQSNPSSNESQSAMTHSTDRASLNYPGRPQRRERLRLSLPEPEQDEPINYSMKYPSEPQRQNNQLSQSHSSAFARPSPKVQNFVGNQSHPRFHQTSESSAQAHNKTLESKPDSKNNSKKSPHNNYSTYTETDLDHDTDQPTDFSLRYMEQDEDVQPSTDQPINYSTRYREQDVNFADHTHPANNRVGHSSLDEDTMRTFCTEGTPLTYLSTSTSLTDLSKVDKEDNQPAKISQPSDQNKDSQYGRYPDSDKMSGTGTQSTDRNTGSAITVRKLSGSPPNKNNLPVPKTSPPGGRNSHPPSLYSYNDSTSTSSPSEKPMAYCTEGTPMSFSRRSSLSSLHSADAKQEDLTLQNEGPESLNASINADVTLKLDTQDDSFQSADTSANTSMGGHGKTVTFDENNQIQETPLMFSRCSSLGSLSSFDAHSVHSSVVSEYSRRASEVVSPSELPDSPSDTMPPSPSRRKSPVRFGQEEESPQPKKLPGISEKIDRHKEDKPIKLDTIPENAEFHKAPESPKQQTLFKDVLRTFADEGSPDDNFSCATSLSGLTFDDEPEIKKDPGLRRVPLGQEMDPAPQSGPVFSLYANKEEARQGEQEKEDICFREDVDEDDINDDDDDNSSVSEGEENLLAECINLAMPTRSKKMIKKSSSDGFLKQQQFSNLPAAKSKPISRIPISQSAGSLCNKNSRLPLPSGRPVARLQGIVQRQDNSHPMEDSPKKFATEDTPLNYSRAESLSDISIDSNDGINETMDTVIDASTRRAPAPQLPVKHNVPEDDNSDLSSLSDDEDMLSQAIEAAMPKNAKKAKAVDMDRTAEGSDTKDKPRYQIPGFKKPTAANYPPARVQRVEPQDRNQSHNNSDSVKTYAVEGTPINFSRATSLSDLTVDDMLDAADGASEGGLAEMKAAAKQENTLQAQDLTKPHKITLPDPADNSLDSPKVYGMEGTPMNFSRNDSLSSLSCDDDEDEGKRLEDHGDKTSGVPKGHQKDKQNNQRRSGLQSPAISRLKTPSRRMPVPSSTSTPIAKRQSPGQNTSNHDDQPSMYATEGTPMCFSRNSSLSSLHSEIDHEPHTGMHTMVGGIPCAPVDNVTDVSANYKVEDTPANFSGNSSLSSLSVSAESLSFDPTPSESALLEQCINAAMPKSRKKKDSPVHRTSPNGSSDVASKKKTPRTELFAPPALEEEDENQTPKSKNVEGPQDMIKTGHLQDNYVPGPESQVSELDTIPEENNRKDDMPSQEDTSDYQEDEKSPEESTPQIVRQSSEDVDGSDVDADYEDEKLMEAIHEVESKVAEFDFRTEAPSEQSLCLEARQLPQHLLLKTAASKPVLTHSAEGSMAKTLEFTASTVSSDMDLMKESFPDMSVSLVSNLTTPDQEALKDLEQGSADTTLSTNANNTVINLFEQATEPNNDDTYEAKEDRDFGWDDKLPDISLEDQQALEENANIILSELSMERELSTSCIDDDMFIENETISLVSNDYTSDTASEVSVSFSSSSKATSEQASEVSSSATISLNSSPKRVGQVKPTIVKPRIMKPGENTQPQANKQQDGPKGIRGGKRLASAAIRGVASPAKGPATAKTTPPKGIRGGPPQKPSPPAGNKTLVSTPQKKITPGKSTPVRAGGPQAPKSVPRVSSASNVQSKIVTPPARSSSTPPKSNQGSSSPKSSPKPVRRASSAGPNKQITPPKTMISRSPASGIPKPGGKASPRGAINKTPAKDSIERPAPPVKQGTFTKDSPTQNGPEISEDTLENTDLNGNKSNEKRRSIPTPGGVKARDRSSSGTPPQRQSPPGGAYPKTDAKRTPSKTSLNKTSSASSLNKSGSSSSLNKSGNNNNRTPLKRNDSLRKSDGAIPRKTESPRRGSVTSNTSRSSTPQGRPTPQGRSVTPQGRSTTPSPRSVTPTSRLSTPPSKITPPNKKTIITKANTPPMQTETPVQTQKKPAVSKIAGLWRKENKENKKVETTNKPAMKENRKNSLEESNTNSKSSKGPKSPKTSKKFSKFGKSKKNEKTKLTPTEDPEDGLAPLKRSSTYDKLTPDVLEVAPESTISIDDVPSTSDQSLNKEEDKSLWRRTYTIPSEDDRSSDVSSLGRSTEEIYSLKGKIKKESSKRRSLSIWKRNSQDVEKDKDTDITLMEPPKEIPKKKGFSLWRRESKKNSSKIPSPKTPVAQQQSGSTSDLEGGFFTDVQADTPETRRKRPDPPKRLEGSSLPVAEVISTPNQNVTVIDTDNKVGVISAGSPLTSPTRSQAPANAAIVAPFNYNPNQKTSTNGNISKEEVFETTTSSQEDKSSKHMTKTEMLIARRRQSRQSFLNSQGSLNKEGDSSSDNNSQKQHQGSCLVTTV